VIGMDTNKLGMAIFLAPIGALGLAKLLKRTGAVSPATVPLGIFSKTPISIKAAGTYNATFASLDKPSSAKPGSTVYIRGSIKNTGDLAGRYGIVLEVDGIKKATSAYDLDPGEISPTLTLSFTMPPHDVSGYIWIQGP